MILSPDDIISLNTSGVSWGACYTYSPTGTSECVEKTKTNCYGGVFDAGVTCTPNYYPNFTKNENNLWTSDPIAESTISTFKPGDHVLGGVYVGTLTPNKESFSDKVQMLSSTNSTNYAIVMYEQKIIDPYLKNSHSKLNPNTSIYDGAYNSVFANKVKVNFAVQNDTYKDWYIASIAELNLIKKLYKRSSKFRSIVYNLYGNTDIKITSSSVFNINTNSKIQKSSLLNEKYLYAMDFNTGDIILFGAYIESILMYIRRIIVVPS